MDLDEVLGGTPEAEPQPTAQTTAQPEPVTGAEPAASGDPAAPPAATDTAKLVPLEALDAERKGRKDWKEKALRLEGRYEALEKEIAALRAPQPAAQPQPVSDMPDPFLDPQGYADYVERRAQQRVVFERLATQEEAVKEKHGAEAVDAAWARFQEAFNKNPAVEAELKGQRNPWAKLMEWDKRQQAQAEIGDDPAAFRERIREEERKRILEEMGQSPTPASPAATPALRIPQSLATSPNVSGARGGAAFTGPSPLSDLVRRH